MLERKLKSLIFPYILRSLKETAHSLIERKKPVIVGVTGSVGKSSFIYLLDSIVHDRFKTKTTFQGNSETGLPLEILNVRDRLHDYSLLNWLVILALTPFAYLFNRFDFELLIAEMSIDSTRPPKNMSYLLEILSPNVGVFLSVSPAHTQQFAEELNLESSQKEEILQAIANEKGKLVTTLSNQAYAVINGDSPYIQNLLGDIQAKIITFGSNAHNDFQLHSHQFTSRGTQYTFSAYNTPYSLSIDNFLLSQEYGLTILAVIASAGILGVSVEAAIDDLKKKFVLPPGRMSLIPGKHNTSILDSSYNSSPSALSSVLNAVENVPCAGKKILILGDMRELGPLAEAAHQDLAEQIAKIGEIVVLVGPLMKKYLETELQKRGVVTLTFDVSLGVGSYLLQHKLISPKDLIVVKGSQNRIYLEQVVLELMKSPELANSLLCRQSKYWNSQRKQYWREAKN